MDLRELSDHQEIERRRGRLLARIHRRYQTSSHPVRIGPIAFTFTRIADPDRVLDQVAEEEDRREKVTGQRHRDDELHLPYWAELWDSAVGIGQFLVRAARRHEPALNLDRTLDLGCGMGLSGSVAAALGGQVLFADIETPALLFAALNSLPWHSHVRTRRTNWRTDHLGRQFTLIVGADILYEKAQWPYLEPFWRKHLAPGGTVLLGEPGRQTGDQFLDWIKPKPWSMTLFEEMVPAREKPLRVLLLRPTA
jgi:predicted nicotinamide N-methyase